jgi:hypothetical protein
MPSRSLLFRRSMLRLRQGHSAPPRAISPRLPTPVHRLCTSGIEYWLSRDDCDADTVHVCMFVYRSLASPIQIRQNLLRHCRTTKSSRHDDERAFSYRLLAPDAGGFVSYDLSDDMSAFLRHPLIAVSSLFAATLHISVHGSSPTSSLSYCNLSLQHLNTMSEPKTKRSVRFDETTKPQEDLDGIRYSSQSEASRHPRNGSRSSIVSLTPAENWMYVSVSKSGDRQGLSCKSRTSSSW